MPDSRPVCFVVMPFGVKKDPGGGRDIDFDRIYEDALRPAIEAAGLESVRADGEQVGGIVHKPMFERLLLCDYVLADLTTANPNVFYELGVRHAVRPATTLAIFARQQKLPFDVGVVRALPYALDEENRLGANEAETLRAAVAERLQGLRENAANPATDSPVFQLLPDYGPPEIDRLKTDVFRDRLHYSAQIQDRLAKARVAKDLDALHQVEQGVASFAEEEIGVLVDLFVSYRALKQWPRMLELYERFPRTLQRSVMVREQLGFALNREKRREEATQVLEGVLAEYGPSSETCGILGRVYKDLWSEAVANEKAALAAGFLDKAITTYVEGFEADWRDAYPGINAVTLLDIRGTEASLAQRDELLPLVHYAAGRRIAGGQPDYWDYATMLELAVLAFDAEEANEHLARALTEVREPWEPETTANNLELIRRARKDRGEDLAWLDEIIAALKPA